MWEGREHNHLFTTVSQLCAQHWHVINEHGREEGERHVENDAWLIGADNYSWRPRMGFILGVGDR